MSLDYLLDNDFHLLRFLSPDDPISVWENFMEHYGNFILQHAHKKHYLGLPNTLLLNHTPMVFQEWLKSNPNVHVFYFVRLMPHQEISPLIAKIPEISQKKLHILPDSDLNYGRFKEELWDLHLAGYQIYFHHTNEVKTFAKNTELFQKLANRGVSVGVSANWSPTWLGNDIQKIQTLIQELGVHFFDTEYIKVDTDSYTKEQENQQQILQLGT
jgi:hypothetical protein